MESKHSVYIEWQNETFQFRERLSSFNLSTISYHDKIGLAKSGFFYTGYNDHVKCMQCQGTCQIWNLQQNTYTEHLRLWPYCSFVQETESKRHNDTCPEYEHLLTRLKTFPTWLEQKLQSFNSFAAAGFYYIGTLDRVQCFSCGTALKEWGSEDDPVAVHKRVCPCCVYIHGNSIQLLGISLAAKTQSADSDVIRGHIIEVNVQSYDEQLNCNASTMQLKRTTMTSNPLFQTMLNLGFDENAILQEMRIRILKSGHNFEDVNEFLDTVWKRDGFTKTASVQSNADVSSTARLREENTHIRNLLSCKICRKPGQRASVMFLPCRHLIACTQCAESVNKCSVCEMDIIGTVHVQRF